MNERIAKLYDQALVLESNGDYVAGELDPVKFAELIVKECMYVGRLSQINNGLVDSDIKDHFYGVEIG